MLRGERQGGRQAQHARSSASTPESIAAPRSSYHKHVEGAQAGLVDQVEQDVERQAAEGHKAAGGLGRWLRRVRTNWMHPSMQERPATPNHTGSHQSLPICCMLAALFTTHTHNPASHAMKQTINCRQWVKNNDA